MRRVYRRLLRGATTINKLNRLHIALENRLTPQEVLDLRALLPKQKQRSLRVSLRAAAARLIRVFPEGWRARFRRSRRSLEAAVLKEDLTGQSIEERSRFWILKLATGPGFGPKVPVQPFVRRGIVRDIVLYTGGGDPSKRTLVLAFTGTSQRMKMPAPVFLQHFDSATTDVAILRDPKRSGYRKGMQGVGDDIFGVVEKLPDLLATRSHRRVVAIGSSGGGQIGLIAGLQLGVATVLWLGGNEPGDPRWADLEEGGVAELLRKLRAGPGRDVNLIYGYGPANEKDGRAARDLQAMLGGRLEEITDPAGPVGHNTLYPLVLSGRLRGFFEDTIFAG